MAASASDPLLWEDFSANSPPLQWQFVATDSRWWWNATSQAQDPITYIGADPLPASLELDYEIVTPPASGNMILRHTQAGVDVNVSLGASGSGSIVIVVTDPDAAFSFRVYAENDPGEDMYGATVAVLGPSVVACPVVNFNCDCDDTVPYETRLQLQNRLMVRLGYAGQVSNPPPGMAALLQDFLVSSQRLLYMKYTELRTERIFTWEVAEGDRLFDLNSNDDQCTKTLNALKLTWVGMEDATGCENGQWYPLISGIRPEFYTSINSPGFPSHYEIRQCIEIFPPASKAMRLRVKGHYELLPFTADSHQTTIDSELVFLWALATAKAHYGHPDADNIAAMANDYLGRLVGGKHGTKRYVPGAVQLPAAARPVMRDGYLP